MWGANIWTDLLCRPFEHQLQPNGILISTRHRAVLQETRSVHIHRVLKMNEDTGLELLLKDILRKQEIEMVEDLEIFGDKLS